MFYVCEFYQEQIVKDKKEENHEGRMDQRRTVCEENFQLNEEIKI